VGIKGISYVHLLVEDWPMALQFYRDIVGLEVEQLFEIEESVTFNLGGAKLVVYGGGVGSLQPKGADKNAFVPNLECEDLAATVAELEARGVPFIATPDESPEGYRLATFVDPEGNRIQLFEWAREGEPT
jgi:predicted enzyme related to lactoylglutathione lyase